MENPLNKYGHKNKLYPIKRIAHERLHCIKMDLNTKSIKQIIIILDIPYAMNTFPIIRRQEAWNYLKKYLFALKKNC